MEITADEVEVAVRDWATMFSGGDMERGIGFEAGSVGYGYRSAAARDLRGDIGTYRVGLKQLYEGLTSLEIEFERLETSATAGVGLAWGFFHESVERKDGTRERVRVRFSMTLAKDGDGWHMLLFHRDAQPFDEKGGALPGTFAG